MSSVCGVDHILRKKSKEAAIMAKMKNVLMLALVFVLTVALTLGGTVRICRIPTAMSM